MYARSYACMRVNERKRAFWHMYARNANTIVHSNLQGVPFTSSVPRGLIYFPAGKSKTSQHPPSYSLLRQALNRAPRPRLPPRRQRIVSHLVCVPLVGFKQSRRQLPAFVLNVPQLTTNRQTDNRQTHAPIREPGGRGEERKSAKAAEHP